MADVYAACVGRFYEDLAEQLVEGARAHLRGRRARGRGPRRARRLRAAAGGEVLRRVRPLRRRGLPRRGDPRRDQPLRLRLRRGRARDRARVARHRRAVRVRRADRRDMEQALARVGGGKRHQGEDAAHAVLRMAALRRELAALSTVNLFSDTQTRPSDGMRAAMATPRWATSSASPTRRRSSCRSASPSCSATRRRCSCRAARCATRSRFRLHLRPGGDEVMLDRQRAPDRRRGRRPGAGLRRDDPHARRRRRHLHGAAGRGGAAPAGRPLPRRARASSRSSRRRTWAAAASGRSTTMREVLDVARATRPAHAPRRRAADERGRSPPASAAADYAGRLRHRLARLHQGPRRAGGRGARAARAS